MIDETVASEDYTVETLRDILASNAVSDSEGRGTSDPDWELTIDIYAAAAEVWEEKGAHVALDFDFSGGDASFSRTSTHTHAMRQARYYRNRARAKTIPTRYNYDTNLSAPVNAPES
jgi:hypothetical protein